jgi:hypothetical protein
MCLTRVSPKDCPSPKASMKRDLTFRSFLAAYPPVAGMTRQLDGVSLAEAIEERFGIDVPGALQFFWLRVGAGAFGDNELYIFGDDTAGLPGPTILEWNSVAPWRPLYPEPSDGGPFYFAQTPFGDQLGFRWQKNVAVPELFVPESVESFVLAADLDELLCDLLVTPGALCESDGLAQARGQLGSIPPDQHYVADPSPNGKPAGTFHVEPAEAHLTGAISRWRATMPQPAG